jgi:signal peptidase I
MNVLRRGLDLALAVLVTAVLLVGLTAYLAPAIGGRALAIRSGSMAPAIGVGSLVVAVKQDPATLQVGDVVTVGLSGGAVLTHRIDEVVQQDDRRMFRLRGDANSGADPALVTQDQLLGRVVLTMPLLGFLLALMAMPSGVVALLSTGGILLTAAWLLDDQADTTSHKPRKRRVRPSVDVLDWSLDDPTDPAAGMLDLGYEAGRGRR